MGGGIMHLINQKALGVALFLCLTSALFSQVVHPEARDIVHAGPWKYHAGDNAAWAHPDLNDSNWDIKDPREFGKQPKGIHWYRAHFEVERDTAHTSLWYLYIFNLPMAFEVYWDGEKFGTNGIVGTDLDSESPGSVLRIISLPQGDIDPGSHVLAIRLSNWHTSRNHLISSITVSPWKQLLRYSQNRTGRIFFYIGLYSIIFLFTFVIFFGGWRQPSYIFLTLYAGVVILVRFWNLMADSDAVTVLHYQWAEMASLYGSVFSDLCVAAFSVIYFRVRRAARLILLISAGIVVLQGLIGVLGLYRTLDLTHLFILGFVLIYLLVRRDQKSLGEIMILTGISFRMGIMLLLFFQLAVNNLFIIRMFQVLHVSSLILAVILKILEQHRQLQIVSRQAKQMKSRLQQQSTAQSTSHLVFRLHNENHLLPLKKILYFKSDRIYTEVHTLDGAIPIVVKPLNQLEKELPDSFLRIHRSYIVNLHHIRSYRHIGGSTYQVLLKQDIQLPVSRSRWAMLKSRLQSF